MCGALIFASAVLVCGERHGDSSFILCEGQRGGKLRILRRQRVCIGIVLVEFHAGTEPEVQGFFTAWCASRLHGEHMIGTHAHVAVVDEIELMAFQAVLDRTPHAITFGGILKLNVCVPAIVEHKNDPGCFLVLRSDDALNSINRNAGDGHGNAPW